MKRFSCDELVELVTAFLENDLDESTRSRFEEHLVGCEGCEHYLDQFRTTVDILGTLRSESLPGDGACHALRATSYCPPFATGGRPEFELESGSSLNPLNLNPSLNPTRIRA